MWLILMDFLTPDCHTGVSHMVLKMARPTRRTGSSSIQFRQRIPARVRKAAVGKTFYAPVGNQTVAIKIGPATKTIQFSLRTRDPAEAKSRQAIAQERLQQFWGALSVAPRG